MCGAGCWVRTQIFPSLACLGLVLPPMPHTAIYQLAELITGGSCSFLFIAVPPPSFAASEAPAVGPTSLWPQYLIVEGWA